MVHRGKILWNGGFIRHSTIQNLEPPFPSIEDWVASVVSVRIALIFWLGTKFIVVMHQQRP